MLSAVTFAISLSSDLSSDTDIIVRTLKQPNCVKVDIDDNGNINFDIEKELGDLTGLAVKAGNDANVAALGEMWKGGGQGAKIEDEVDENVINEIDQEVNENYIEEEKNESID